MNLIEDAWIPVRRRSGEVTRIAPWQLTDGFAEDPFVELAAPRPDFNGALVQFLIGLLQTCFAPENPREWRQRLRHAPTSVELRTTFATIAAHFDLDGDGARFLQDFTLEEEIAALGQATTRPVGDLLIGNPTGKTLDDNGDLFVKRDRIAALCRACAATALLTLQTNAPAQGRGYVTGIRGGGPLTTIILGDSLWTTSWLNVLDDRSFLNTTGNPARDMPPDRFPWLGPTRTSEGGRSTTPEDAHPAQVFWAMPRRIRLVFSDDQADCDLCGVPNTKPVRRYQTQNPGVKYAHAWRHPLSPHFVGKNGVGGAVHPREAIGYRHWLGLVQSSGDDRTRREPAAVVERYLLAERAESEDLRLWAFGYEMEKMKARCWHQSIMPLVLCPPENRKDFAAHVAAAVKSAELAATETCSQLRKVLFKPGSDVKGDLSFITARYWEETERPFYALLFQVREALRGHADVTATLEGWHRTLIETAQHIFDSVSQTGAFDAVDPKRVALAWRDLQSAIRGRKMTRTLGLPDRSTRKARVGRRTEGR